MRWIFVFSFCFISAWSQVTINEPISIPLSTDFNRGIQFVLTDNKVAIFHGGYIGIESQLFLSEIDENQDIVTTELSNLQGSLVNETNGPQLLLNGNEYYLILDNINTIISTSSWVDIGFSNISLTPSITGSTPRIAIAEDGSIELIVQNEEQTAWLNYSIDNEGNVVLGPIVVNELVPGNNIAEGDEASIVIADNGDVVVSYRNKIIIEDFNHVNDVWLAIKPQGTSQFSQVLDIDTTDWNLPSSAFDGTTSFAVGNKIYTVFRSQLVDERWVYLNETDLTDLTTSRTKAISPLDTLRQFLPDMIIKGDTIGIIWNEFLPVNQSDMFIAWSFTGYDGMGENILQITDTQNRVENYGSIEFDNQVFHLTYNDFTNKQIIYQTVDVNPITDIQVAENQLETDFYIQDDQLIVSNCASCSYQIYNTLGALIASGKLDQGYVDLTPFNAKEMYFLQIIRENQTQIIQFFR